MAIIVRRLALAALISLVPRDSPFQSCGVFFVLLLSLGIQFNLQPYSSRLENLMEELGLLTIILSYAAQLAAIYSNAVHDVNGTTGTQDRELTPRNSRKHPRCWHPCPELSCHRADAWGSIPQLDTASLGQVGEESRE